MRFVDLLRADQASPPEVPEVLRTEITFSGHAEGAARSRHARTCPRACCATSEGWAVEEFTGFGTHSSRTSTRPGTTTSTIGDERAQTIDELPLAWFFADGVVLDMTGKADGETVRLRRRGGRARGHRARPQAARHRPRADGPGRLLRAAGLRAAGLARHRRGDPLAVRAGRAGHGHRRLGLGRAAAPPGRGGAGRGSRGSSGPPTRATCPTRRSSGWCNLAALPPTGFTVSCFPLRIVGGSAAPARVVAILDD